MRRLWIAVAVAAAVLAMSSGCGSTPATRPVGPSSPPASPLTSPAPTAGQPSDSPAALPTFVEEPGPKPSGPYLKVDPAAYLPPANYPHYNVYAWRDAPRYDTRVGEGQSPFPCGQTYLRDLGMVGYQEHGMIGNADGDSGPPPLIAGERLWFFKDTASAAGAWAYLRGAFQSCGRGSTATQTASNTQGVAFSLYSSGGIAPPFPYEYHVMVVQRGPVIGMVEVAAYHNDKPRPVYDPSGDLPILQLMAKELCRYGGSC